MYCMFENLYFPQLPSEMAQRHHENYQPRPRLSYETRVRISQQLEDGVKPHVIAKQHGCCVSTVYLLNKKREQGLSLHDLPRRHTESKLTSADVGYLGLHAKRHPHTSFSQLARLAPSLIGKHVSRPTISRSLRAVGLVSRKDRRKPLLTHAHKTRRTKAARAWLKLGPSYWAQTMFTDEHTVNLLPTAYNSYSVQHHSLPPELRPQQGTSTFGGKQLHLFAAITPRGFATFTFYDTPLSALRYISILKATVFKKPQKRWFRGRWHFQQDGASAHTAAATRRYLDRQKILANCDVPGWPSKSPDLNPIENVWAELNRRLGLYDTLPTNLHVLRERVRAVIADLNSPACRHFWAALYNSMPTRLYLVKKYKGAATRY